MSTSQRLQPIIEAEENNQILEDRIRDRRVQCVQNGNYGNVFGAKCGYATTVQDTCFHKYKGLSYPKIHIIMYCQKIASYIYNDLLLIHYFQDNLSGASPNW